MVKSDFFGGPSFWKPSFSLQKVENKTGQKQETSTSLWPLIRQSWTSFWLYSIYLYKSVFTCIHLFQYRYLSIELPMRICIEIRRMQEKGGSGESDIHKFCGGWQPHKGEWEVRMSSVCFQLQDQVLVQNWSPSNPLLQLYVSRLLRHCPPYQSLLHAMFSGCQNMTLLQEEIWPTNIVCRTP